VKGVADTKVGEVTHYYDKIGVAVVEVIAPLKVGDKIKIVSGDNEFEQEVASMQVEHKNVQSAKKGDAVGLKVDQPVKRGEVFKVA
jgi:translation elongation factor EF-1alpha